MVSNVEASTTVVDKSDSLLLRERLFGQLRICDSCQCLSGKEVVLWEVVQMRCEIAARNLLTARRHCVKL